MTKDTNTYFAKGCGRCDRFASEHCSALLWHDGLMELRSICLKVGLTEHSKWGHPCYVHADRNIAIIGAFQKDFRLSFFNAALMTDPNNLLQKSGPNTQHKDMFRFTHMADVEKIAPHIEAYLLEAMGYADRGLKPLKENIDLEWPEELINALEADPVLADAFYVLTPGRQRSYVINLNGAKAPATRLRRIEKFRAKIIAGKGAQEY